MEKAITCTTCGKHFYVKPEDVLRPASGGKFVLCWNVNCFDLCPVNDGNGGSFGQKIASEPKPVLT